MCRFQRVGISYAEWTEHAGCRSHRTFRRAAPPPRPASLVRPEELPPLDRRQAPWPGREVTSGGVRLHVRETPGPEDAIAALYVHGLAGSATNWTDLAAQLSPHAPGMSVDLPGFGRSRPLSSNQYTPTALVDAVLCFLAGLNRPVHLLGNSMGGAIAVSVAARRPELVRTLTLVSPAMPDRRPDPRRVADPRMVLAAVPGLGRRAARALAALTPRQRVEQMIQLCFADPESVSERRIAEAVEEMTERGHQAWATEALWQTTQGMIKGWFGPPSLWTALAAVTAPTLVVWGEQDRLVSPKLAARAARTPARGRLLWLPDVGHVAQIERPVTVARAVLALWRAADADDG
jgi:pimeloyl-ACP methyl ester carboxylesterase